MNFFHLLSKKKIDNSEIFLTFNKIFISIIGVYLNIQNDAKNLTFK